MQAARTRERRRGRGGGRPSTSPAQAVRLGPVSGCGLLGGFVQWWDTGVFAAFLEGMIAGAAKRDAVNLSLVGVDSTTARAHHDAAGMHLPAEVIGALEKAAAEEEQARERGAARRNKTGTTTRTPPDGSSAGACGPDTRSG
ncbi:hypothetical protein FraQA3DRAFT_0890 [Frankia sp. QA3]|nr:hypothetical protein FraQA3DRAFT_0890 [Frankia sp. QA3]